MKILLFFLLDMVLDSFANHETVFSIHFIEGRHLKNKVV